MNYGNDPEAMVQQRHRWLRKGYFPAILTALLLLLLVAEIGGGWWLVVVVLHFGSERLCWKDVLVELVTTLKSVWWLQVCLVHHHVIPQIIERRITVTVSAL